MADDILGAKRLLRRQMLGVRGSIASAPVGNGESAAERSDAACERLAEVVAERFADVPHAGLSNRKDNLCAAR